MTEAWIYSDVKRVVRVGDKVRCTAPFSRFADRYGRVVSIEPFGEGAPAVGSEYLITAAFPGGETYAAGDRWWRWAGTFKKAGP